MLASSAHGTERERELIRPQAKAAGPEVALPGAVEPAQDFEADGLEFEDQLRSERAARVPFERGLAGEAHAAFQVCFEKAEQSPGGGVVGGALPLVLAREHPEQLTSPGT